MFLLCETLCLLCDPLCNSKLKYTTKLLKVYTKAHKDFLDSLFNLNFYLFLHFDGTSYSFCKVRIGIFTCYECIQCIR